MDALFSPMLAWLHFFSTGFGVLAMAALAASIFLLWSWRWTLCSLFVIQTGVAVVVMEVLELPATWAGVQILVMALCVLLFVLAVQPINPHFQQRAPGPWTLRFLVLILLLVSWQLFDLNLKLPLLTPAISRLFVWLALCALVIFCLSDAPFFTGVALLLWSIPMQAMVEVLTPGHSLSVLIGIMEIVITVASTYLVMLDAAPAPLQATISTDLSFPDQPPSLRPLLPAPRSPRAHPQLSGPTSRPALPAEPPTERPLVARSPQ